MSLTIQSASLSYDGPLPVSVNRAPHENMRIGLQLGWVHRADVACNLEHLCDARQRV